MDEEQTQNESSTQGPGGPSEKSAEEPEIITSKVVVESIEQETKDQTPTEIVENVEDHHPQSEVSGPIVSEGGEISVEGHHPQSLKDPEEASKPKEQGVQEEVVVEEPKEVERVLEIKQKEKSEAREVKDVRPIIEIKGFGQKAVAAIFKKRQARLEKIMRLAMEVKKKGKSINNNDVQLAVLVSDATASRYLTSLAKKGMLVKKGAGRDVEYEFPG